MRLAFTLGLSALLSAGPVLADPLVKAVSSVVTSGDGEALAPTPPAEGCGWSAEMEDDEGGQTMVASSCQSDTESGPVFRLLCSGEINIRYNEPDLIMNAPEAVTLVLTSGGESLTTEVVFEEMDAAFAAYVAMDSPILSLLKASSEVGVTLRDTNLPPRTVSLNGSTAAIEKLINACK